MKVFTCHHEGHWSVGACSIVTAFDAEKAKQLIKQVLIEEYGVNSKQALEEIELDEVDLGVEKAKVLTNGEY